VAEASDGRDAVRQALSTQPDVAVLDIGMPFLNGIEATRQVVRRLPTTHVLILSMHSDEAYIIQALKAGARGYMLKDSADTDLIRGVAAVAAGKSFFSPAVAKVMLDDYVRHLVTGPTFCRSWMSTTRPSWCCTSTARCDLLICSTHILSGRSRRTGTGGRQPFVIARGAADIR
jgi:CheY-like chemotaxis protein